MPLPRGELSGHAFRRAASRAISISPQRLQPLRPDQVGVFTRTLKRRWPPPYFSQTSPLCLAEACWRAATARAASLANQHAIAVAVKAVSLLDGMLVGLQDLRQGTPSGVPQVGPFQYLFSGFSR